MMSTPVAGAGEGRGAAALLAQVPGGVGVVDRDHRAVALGEVADFGELGHIAVHRKDAVGDDELEARALGVGSFELGFEVVHVAVGVTEAFCLAEAYAVDDRGVVEGVGNYGVLRPEQRFEQPAIGVERGGKEDRVILAQVTGHRLLELAVERLRPADEAHRRHTEAVFGERVACRGANFRVVGEAEIVVRAEI
jgi:hypothetical protein